VDLGPGETKYVNITEATPVQRTFELGSDEALGMMKVFIAEPDASPQLRAQIEAVLATHRNGADLMDKIATLREQLAEYRSRSGELNAQLVTLKMVRTSGELMANLRTKQADMSERIQKTTIALVEAQEQLMLSRVKFQNQLADLRLTDATKPVTSAR
jgi:septal ring factor EnvC (AmiA/AmiB activator)